MEENTTKVEIADRSGHQTLNLPRPRHCLESSIRANMDSQEEDASATAAGRGRLVHCGYGPTGPIRWWLSPRKGPWPTEIRKATWARVRVAPDKIERNWK